jgi:hypothetical protein
MEEDYSAPGYLRYLGASLTEMSEGELGFETGDKEAETLLKALAGFSNGVLKFDINFKSLIPKAGLEADFINVAVEHRTIELVWRIANMEITVRGRIISGKLSTSVGNINMSDVTFRGRMVSKVQVAA